MSKIFEAESFLYNANCRFIEELYQKYLSDPSSVDASWQLFFKNYQTDKSASEKLLKGATWAPNKTKIIATETEESAAKKPEKTSYATQDSSYLTEKMTQAFRVRGHKIVHLDPLGLEVAQSAKEQNLALEDFGISPSDLKGEAQNIYNHLREIYTGAVGVEFEHLDSLEEKTWLYEQIESLPLLRGQLTKAEKSGILKDLIEAESFESFLHSRFPGAKRFSVEGGEASLVFMLEVIKGAAVSGYQESILGMAHRGRLNMLTKIYGKSYASLFGEFRGNLKKNPEFSISGDVKYHAGKSTDKEFSGNKIHLTMLPNPSHLEAVNPVLQGKVRARQDLINDKDRNKIQGILIHGDAAVAGQGVVAESLTFANIAGYRSGGTMHLVTNNQVGFTATAQKSRGGRYPTEIAKSILAPIIHVNSEDPEAVLLIARIAEKYRQKFSKDIMVDLVCYRKYGHNEGDEPMFTQPVMYSIIKERKNPHQLYFDTLQALDEVNETEYKKLIADFIAMLDGEYNKSAEPGYYENHMPGGAWQGITIPDKSYDLAAESTGIASDDLKKIGEKLYIYPEGFSLNSKIERLLKTKKEMFDTGKKLDWATAEALAFGSLLLEGTKVRLSGQDSGRGTFSHRHSVLVDQKTEATFIPLNNLAKNQESYEVIDSNLSEYGVLGFEYGYSLASPKLLVLWEGQFGDFSNGAQIMIDQFISSAEQKWLRMSGLVMLLPHGYEGQGPEHSSARLERYLQLCAENNMQVVNCTTPANYFHALRRQVRRNFRTPLIVMTPKSMLRTLESDLTDFDKNTKFKPVIAETEKLDPKAVKRAVICSGKIYYELLELRKSKGIKDIALIRLEQYYPFPANYLKTALKEYVNAEVIWCQEEPQNMGAWTFVYHYLVDLLKELGFKDNLPQYIGRAPSASPATGYAKLHEEQQRDILAKALNI